MGPGPGGDGGAGGGAGLAEVMTTRRDACGPSSADSEGAATLARFDRATASRTVHPPSAPHDPRPVTADKLAVIVALPPPLLMSRTALADLADPAVAASTGSFFA